jgi:hypothetical protein
MDADIRVADKPVSERFRAIEPIRARIDALPRRYLLSRLLTGSLDLAFIRDLQSTARLRAARTAVAIERYRLAQKGELPHSLDELAPKYLDAVPSDPFDEGQLRYKKLVKGYVVYSVGEDGKDDGGDEKKDIAFTVER